MYLYIFKYISFSKSLKFSVEIYILFAFCNIKYMIYVGDPLVKTLTVWEKVCGAIIGVVGSVGDT